MTDDFPEIETPDNWQHNEGFVSRAKDSGLVFSHYNEDDFSIDIRVSDGGEYNVYLVHSHPETGQTTHNREQGVSEGELQDVVDRFVKEAEEMETPEVSKD